MVHKRFLFLLFLFSGIINFTYAQSGEGQFIITDFPESYNGRYVVLFGRAHFSLPDIYGCEQVNLGNNMLTASQIIDGQVILPMWVPRANNTVERYYGNSSYTRIDILIIDVESINMHIFRSPGGLELIILNRVEFYRGSTIRSWNDIPPMWL